MAIRPLRPLAGAADSASRPISPAPPAASRNANDRNKMRPKPGIARTAARGVQVDDLNVGYRPGNLRRCSGCGGMVYLWPCLACNGRRAA